MIENILSESKTIIIYAKDINLKYLFCNEAAAEAAGLDSPQQIVGKTDDDVFWRQYAEYYRSCNRGTLQNGTYINQQTPFASTRNVTATLLSTETILKDKKGYSKGVVGHAIDITGYSVTKNNGYVDSEKNIFYLGANFGNAYLTKHEFAVFKELLLGSGVEKIAFNLKCSIKTIRSQIKSIAHKLQCSHQSEIVSIAIKYGLTYVLSDINLSISPSTRKSVDPHLTQKQINCLIHLVKGKTIKQIAHTLNLSAKTIEHYLDAIKTKLHAQDRSALIEKALQLTEIRERL